MDATALWATLARTPSLDATTLRALAAQLTSTDHSPSEGCEALLQLPGSALAELGLSGPAIAWLRAPSPSLLDADLAALEQHRLQLLPATSPRYPSLLAQQAGAPAVLWLRGSASVLSTTQLAIVGSRNPSATGRSTAYDFAHYFARGGLTITSGLALGIDGAAHKGALAAGGPTIAVCGTGLDTTYPREHAALAEQITAQGGALLSEFPPQTAPKRWHFPARNRLMSGLAKGVLVVEAARRSGSLITARHAGDQGREVFAIPGSIHNPMARGCHQLIRQGAKLVEAAADVFAELGIPDLNQSLKQSVPGPQQASQASSGLDNAYKILLHALAFEPTSLDTLVVRTGLPSQSVASMLLILELEGEVAPQPGGRFIRLRGTG
jgi:DNA processing protein